MITFTINDTSGISTNSEIGGWKRIEFYNINDTMYVEYCIFEYGKNDFVPLFISAGSNGTIYFRNNIMRNNYKIITPYASVISPVSVGSLHLSNNIFYNNRTGAIHLFGGGNSVLIYDNVIANNHVAFTMQYHDVSDAQIYNNTICNNEEVFYYAESCTFTISNSIIYGNTYNFGYTRINCLETDPMFYSSPSGVGPGNYGSGVNLYPQANSPAVDAGDTTGLPYIPATDFFGRPRIYGSAIDIGALEYQPGVFVEDIKNEKNKITPYPNPTTGFIYFNTNKIIKTEIYNLEGKLLKTIANTNTCNISELKSDVYLLKTYLQDNSVLMYHIVKQ
jgi:hypothetical protein